MGRHNAGSSVGKCRNRADRGFDRHNDAMAGERQVEGNGESPAQWRHAAGPLPGRRGRNVVDNAAGRRHNRAGAIASTDERPDSCVPSRIPMNKIIPIPALLDGTAISKAIRPVQVLLTFGLFIITAHRLPAPISEESSPTPAPTGSAQVKPKPAESPASEALSESELALARRFDGTWQVTGTKEDAAGSSRWVATIVIDGKKAQWSRETTSILAAGKTWPQSWLPPPYNAVSPIFERWVDESTDLKIEGSTLTIRWPVDRLAEWSPKTIPARFFEKTRGSANTVTYILNGDQLTSTDGKITATWYRVK